MISKFRSSHSFTLAVIVLLIVSLFWNDAQTLFAHHSVDNSNARAEALVEFSPHTVSAVQATFDFVPASIFPSSWTSSWVWFAISATDPFLGDCHNGETAAGTITAARAGWIKLSLGGYTPAREMLAYYKNTGAPRVVQGGLHDAGSFPYWVQYVSGTQWNYYMDSLSGTINDGPSQKMKCVTFGGWSKFSSLPFSSASLADPLYKQNGGWTGVPPISHSVRHSSYVFDPPLPPFTYAWFFNKP